MCTKFHGSVTKSLRENPFFGGVSNFVAIDFSSIFYLSFEEFKFCFSTSTFRINFLRMLMTGTNSR